MLLLHGLGSSSLVWNSLIPSLTAHHEVFALDLRGHGRSSTANWTWNSAVADLDAVFAHFHIDEAQLVGHSLGGVLAVVYASRRPRITSLVNIDGRASSDVTLFRGLDPDWTRDKLAAIRVIQEQNAARQFSREEVAAVADAAQARAWENGESVELARDAIFRCLEQLPDGAYRLRPGPSEISSFLDALEEINLFELYPQLTCRCLVVCGTEAAHAPSELPWLPELQRAHIAGETRELEAFSRSHPALRLERIPSSHARLMRKPQVADLINTFLDHQPHKRDDHDHRVAFYG